MPKHLDLTKTFDLYEYKSQLSLIETSETSSLLRPYAQLYGETQGQRWKRQHVEAREVFQNVLYAGLESSMKVRQPDDLLPPDAHVYSEREAKKKRKEYKIQAEKGTRLNMDFEAFRNSTYMDKLLAEKVSGCDTATTQGELFEECRMGKFNDFEKLDPILRDSLARDFMLNKMTTFIHDGGQLLSPKDVALKISTILGHEGLTHPLMRLGISIGMSSGFGAEMHPSYLKELDEALNTRVMWNTLTTFPETEQKDALKKEYVAHHSGKAGADLLADLDVEDSVQRDLNSKKFICKSLLLAHLGGLTVKKKDSHDRDWTGPIANAFAHCSRVMFTLPSGALFKEKLMGLNAGRVTVTDRYSGAEREVGFEKRRAATHRVSPASKGKEAQEVKVHGGHFFNQAGINVAIGGLGKAGIGGRTLLDDGSCGHLYRYYTEGSKTEAGSMLLGFETDAYSKKNQLGHTHGFGNGEKASSFGGQRTDEIGDKYGGRVVDVSKLDVNAMGSMMTAIDDLFDSYTTAHTDVEKRNIYGRICTVVSFLTGPLVDDDVFKILMHNLFDDSRTELKEATYRTLFGAELGKKGNMTSYHE